MFTVKSLGQNNSNNIPILSGINFGFIDMPLFFEIQHEKIQSLLILELIVKNDKTKKTNELVNGGIKKNNWTLYYYNPSIGTSGLTAPIGNQLFENEIFAFMFHIDRLEDANCYKLSYEFYHGNKPK